MEEIEINYKPRKEVEAYHDRKERFAVLVAHRRFGKTVAAINDLIRACFTVQKDNVRVACAVCSQAKAVAGLRIRIHEIFRHQVNHSELRIDFSNGSRFRLYGADEYNAMRGLYYDAVCDEHSDFPTSAWTTVIRPS